MTQQTTWRCEECDAIVTSSSEDSKTAPRCPICFSPKEATQSAEGSGSETYDTRAKTHFAETAGPELDRLLARRVLGGAGEPPAPPYSSEDLAATALAELVGRQSEWSFHLAFCGDAWMATFTEKGDRKNGAANAAVASLVSATGRTRSLAICRALLKVTRCPRWSPLGTNFLRGAQPAIARAAGFELLPGKPGFAST